MSLTLVGFLLCGLVCRSAADSFVATNGQTYDLTNLRNYDKYSADVVDGTGKPGKIQFRLFGAVTDSPCSADKNTTVCHTFGEGAYHLAYARTAAVLSDLPTTYGMFGFTANLTNGDALFLDGLVYVRQTTVYFVCSQGQGLPQYLGETNFNYVILVNTSLACPTGSQLDTVVVAGGYLGGQNIGYPEEQWISALSVSNGKPLWMPLAKMSVPRVTFAYATFDDGQLIMVGNNYGSDNVASDLIVDTYRLSNPSITPVASAPAEPSCFGVTFQDYFYTVSSLAPNTNPNNLQHKSLIRYNRLTNTWANLTQSLNYDRLNDAKVVYNQYIYFFGGVNQTAERYDPVTMKSEVLGNTPSIIGNANAVRLGYYIYIVGLLNPPTSAPSGTVYRYDPFDNTYSVVASLNLPRAFLSATVANGKIYAMGGQVGSSQVYTDTIEVYDPVSNAWTYANAGQTYPDGNNGVALNGAFTIRANRPDSKLFLQQFTNSSCFKGRGMGSELIANTCTTVDGTPLTIVPNAGYTSVAMNIYSAADCRPKSLVRTQTVKLNSCAAIKDLSFVLSRA